MPVLQTNICNTNVMKLKNVRNTDKCLLNGHFLVKQKSNVINYNDLLVVTGICPYFAKVSQCIFVNKQINILKAKFV